MMAPHTFTGSAGAADFDLFVEENYPTAYRFAFCMSLSHENAAQLTHTAFTQARAGQDKEDAPLDKRWLLETLHHDWVSGRPLAAPAITRFDSSAAPLLETKNVAGLDQSLVLQILHDMKEELRLALSLFYFEQLSYGEIAKILEVSPETVLEHLAEAKTVLRHNLDEDRPHSEPLASPRAPSTKGRPVG